MIRLPTTIFVATAPVDLRASFDRLAGLVREWLGTDPRSGAMYVFHNRSRTLVKMLWADTTGYYLLCKRLDRCRYRIPLAIPPQARHVEVSARELAVLLEGLDAAVLRAARRARATI